ncbi:MAG: DUF503 domain-containing protein [Chloroflexi bacterium]|nr:DUF503 domain-containing protein [Chloroflexota bacterium]
MVIGVCRFELLLEDNGSLKGKRSVIRPLVAHVRQRFNVAIAEVDDHDDWERAVLGFAVVSTDAAQTSRMVQSVIDFIERDADASLGSYQVEHIHAF